VALENAEPFSVRVRVRARADAGVLIQFFSGKLDGLLARLGVGSSREF
jgi:hypothetical protein